MIQDLEFSLPSYLGEQHIFSGFQKPRHLMHRNINGLKKKKEMEDKIVQYFIDGIKLVLGEYYIDAIHKFNMLIEESPQSDLADDAMHNIGLCYFRMNQFALAIDTFNQSISSYPSATISEYDHEQAVGMTAAKCYYGIFLCYLSLGKIDLAVEMKSRLNQFSENTYVLTDNHKKTYAELAENLLKTYKLIDYEFNL